MDSRLKDKSREDVMAESNHVSSKGDWLWLVNEFHDISKHRRLVVVNQKNTKVALYLPDTGRAMYKDILDYLPDWLKKDQKDQLVMYEVKCPKFMQQRTVVLLVFLK